jgi:hypothetical protein
MISFDPKKINYLAINDYNLQKKSSTLKKFHLVLVKNGSPQWVKLIKSYYGFKTGKLYFSLYRIEKK